MNTILLPTKKKKKRRSKGKEGRKEEKTSNMKQKTEYSTISTRHLHPWNFPGKSTGVGSHCLLLNTVIKKKNLEIRGKKFSLRKTKPK